MFQARKLNESAFIKRPDGCRFCGADSVFYSIKLKNNKSAIRHSKPGIEFFLKKTEQMLCFGENISHFSSSNLN